MPTQTPDIFMLIDQIVGWVTPILTIIVGLIIFIYRDKVKTIAKDIKDIENDVEKRDRSYRTLQEEHEKRVIEKIEAETLNRKEAIGAIVDTIRDLESNHRKALLEIQNAFKEGIKEERIFRNDIMLKQSDNIDKLFDKLDDVSIAIGRLDQKVHSHIENQERICKLNHAGNG